MQPLTDEILELLAEDKEWHTVDEIARKTCVSRTEAADAVSFLASIKFIQLDKERKKARIDERTDRFLTEIKEEETSEARLPR
jgi:DNA-binding IclR family transcriptional regulator